MLTENDITNLVVDYLNLNGYSNVIGLTTEQRGVDITALNGLGKRVMIEVKGETSSKVNTKRYGMPFTGNQIASHVGGAILKIIVLMNEAAVEGAEFGLAFPMNHEILIRRILPSLKQLGIRIYLVSKEKIIVLK